MMATGFAGIIMVCQGQYNTYTYNQLHLYSLILINITIYFLDIPLLRVWKNSKKNMMHVNMNITTEVTRMIRTTLMLQLLVMMMIQLMIMIKRENELVVLLRMLYWNNLIILYFFEVLFFSYTFGIFCLQRKVLQFFFFLTIL